MPRLAPALSIVQAMIEGKGGDFDQNIVEKELLAGTRGGTSVALMCTARDARDAWRGTRLCSARWDKP